MAIRSTTKAAKEHIRAYILYRSADVDELGYDESIPRVTDPMNVKQIACTIIAVFRLEYSWNIRRMGEYNALKEWMRGLPSVLDTLPLCTYHEARQLVAAWLEETPEESARCDDEAVAAQALHLVARELLALAQ